MSQDESRGVKRSPEESSGIKRRQEALKGVKSQTILTKVVHFGLLIREMPLPREVNNRQNSWSHKFISSQPEPCFR